MMYGEMFIIMFITAQRPAAGRTGTANHTASGWNPAAQTRL